MHLIRKGWQQIMLVSFLVVLLNIGIAVIPDQEPTAHAATNMHAKATSSCYGDGCNGKIPSSYYCSNLAYTVRYANYTTNIGAVARLSLMYSPNCNAFYTELDSFIGSKWEYVKVQRDSHVYSAGWSYTSKINSAMVGWNGTRVYGTNWYNSNSSYGQVSYP